MTLSKVGELIVEFEEGNLTYTWLQGCYGRTLQDLINADLIQTKED